MTSKAFSKFLKALAELEAYNTPQWRWYGRTPNGAVTTWATKERAEEIAGNLQKQFRVVSVDGRFGIQVFE